MEEGLYTLTLRRCDAIRVMQACISEEMNFIEPGGSQASYQMWKSISDEIERQINEQDAANGIPG